MARPSGISLLSDQELKVTVEVSFVEGRGRLNILPRWRNKVEWLRSTHEPVTALMVFVEPGLISLREWGSNSPAIIRRIEELSSSTDEDSLEALRLIQDKYQKLLIPIRDRPTLSDEALAHLEIDLTINSRALIYVCAFPDRINLMSPSNRKTRLVSGHPLVDDLP